MNQIFPQVISLDFFDEIAGYIQCRVLDLTYSFSTDYICLILVVNTVGSQPNPGRYLKNFIERNVPPPARGGKW